MLLLMEPQTLIISSSHQSVQIYENIIFLSWSHVINGVK